MLFIKESWKNLSLFSHKYEAAQLSIINTMNTINIDNRNYHFLGDSCNFMF